MELLRQKNKPNIMFTLSIWDHEERFRVVCRYLG
jgi:heme-degrading monooxygenase HmoA